MTKEAGPYQLAEPDDVPVVDQSETARTTNSSLRDFLAKVALELFIVFVGVSAAFALDDYRSAREDDEKRAAVYGALDRELTQIAETLGPVFQRQMTEQLAAWDRAVASGAHPLPPTFRIPRAERPPTGVWDAAVATGSIELVDPKLFFELARYYSRAESTGNLYQRYVILAQNDVWPQLDEGSGAFWQSDGKLRPEIKAHVMRLRDFRDRQGQLVQEAREIRAKLRRAAAN